MALQRILLLGLGDCRYDAVSEPATIDWVLDCAEARTSAQKADLIVYSMVAPYDLHEGWRSKDVIWFLREVREVNKAAEFWLCTAHDVQIGDPCLEGIDASAVISPWVLNEALMAWCRQKSEEAQAEVESQFGDGR